MVRNASQGLYGANFSHCAFVCQGPFGRWCTASPVPAAAVAAGGRLAGSVSGKKELSGAALPVCLFFWAVPAGAYASACAGGRAGCGRSFGR